VPRQQWVGQRSLAGATFNQDAVDGRFTHAAPSRPPVRSRPPLPPGRPSNLCRRQAWTPRSIPCRDYFPPRRPGIKHRRQCLPAHAANARSARQAALIRNWKPWELSTGPRTEAGKARSAANAFKGGYLAEVRALTVAVNALMREQRELLKRRG
jgi:hypothetical protein